MNILYQHKHAPESSQENGFFPWVVFFFSPIPTPPTHPPTLV